MNWSSDLKKGGALITLDDLAQYNVVERKPVIGTYHNYTIISAPPPSSGGVVLVSALNILEGYDLKEPRRPHPCFHAPHHRSLSPRLHGPLRLPGRPRLQPHSRLPRSTAKKYAAAWRAGILPDKATPSAELKRPAGFLPPAPKTAGSRRGRVAGHHALLRRR